MKPIAVIDTDETLWGFHSALYALAKEREIKLPTSSECTHWNALYMYAPKETVIPLFNEIHANQCSYLPFQNAELFLKLMQTRFYIVIASHRNDEFKPGLIEWLKTNNLVYDEVVVTSRKECLVMNPRTTHVVDDKAELLLFAQKHGRVGIGLSRPWNRKTVDEAFLFDDLLDIWNYIRRGSGEKIKDLNEDLYE
jgi:hypothetical protein